MMVTCNFVNSTWCFQKRILNFCNVPLSHCGGVIADALRVCFCDWRIENKIHTITIDNASANDATITNLKDDFELKYTLLVRGKLFMLSVLHTLQTCWCKLGLHKLRIL
jgi:hypothetical protein